MNPRLLPSRTSASALIVVLWVIGLLSMLVSSFVFEAQVESKLTSYYRKRTQATYLAQSGIDIAEMLLARRETIRDDQEDPDVEGDRWFESAKQLRRGPVIGLKEVLGPGTVTVDIVPEPARRNINNLDLHQNRNVLEVERHLERIFEVGGIWEETGLWPTLIESFMDWIDKDDVPRPDGAETDDYYALQKPPYRAKNGPLDTVGELLLVRGFDRAILYGGTLAPPEGAGGEPVPVRGIEDLLTVYGSSGQVDVNAASMEVLMTLPDVDEIVAGAILEEREGLVDSEGRRKPHYFQSTQDLFTRIPDLPASARPYLTVGSGIFRITSTGEVGGVRRRLRCTAEYSRGGGLVILQWREEN